MINDVKLSHVGYCIAVHFTIRKNHIRKNNKKLSRYQSHDDFSISNLFTDMGYFLSHSQSGINPSNGLNRLSTQPKSIAGLSRSINRK